MIEMGKQYRTRDGREVRIYAVDGAAPYVIHGAMLVPDSGWVRGSWDANGCWINGIEGSSCDLIEVKPRIKRTVWLACLTNGQVAIFHTVEGLETFVLTHRNSVEAVDKHDIDVEHGEGL